MCVCPAPNMFRVLTCVMDFFPFDLKDACVLRHVKCCPMWPLPILLTPCAYSASSSIDPCPRSANMDAHPRWLYNLFIQLQDKQGDQLIASLSGNKAGVVYPDLNAWQHYVYVSVYCSATFPASLCDDQSAFDAFLRKLNPILGNLRDVHEAWSRNEDEAIDSPLLTFTIESWKVGNEKGYGVFDCTSA